MSRAQAGAPYEHEHERLACRQLRRAQVARDAVRQG